MQLPGISEMQKIKIVTGETTYLTTRRMWKAYHYVLALLKSRGIKDEVYLYNLFHYIPGTASVVESNNSILVGVRSQRLAGTHPGMVSIPAGLMKPRELINETNQRELKEESGIPAGKITKIIAVRHPDAPSFTFMCKVSTEQEEIRETYEAKGKTFIWVNKDRILLPAIVDGDNQPLVEELRKQKINVSNNLQIAPDILEGLKRMYK
jgi:8-oxo-dGTP pyrophosphatase MutT (NUDIX family)